MAITLKRQLNDQEKAIIAQRFGRKCFATGHSIAEDEKLQYDHIRAFALGGQSELDNIAPMCEHHNKAKGVLPLEDFRIKLQIEEFFQVGERLTLKNLLKYLKDHQFIGDYGESISKTTDAVSVQIENHSYKGTRVQNRSATLINGLGGRDAVASEPLDRQVKVAWNDIHTPHPRRTVPDCHPYQSRT